jgi:hypothetical protein
MPEIRSFQRLYKFLRPSRCRVQHCSFLFSFFFSFFFSLCNLLKILSPSQIFLPLFSLLCLSVFNYRQRGRGSPCPVSSWCRAGWCGTVSVQSPESMFAEHSTRAPVFSSTWWQGMWGYGLCRVSGQGKGRERAGKII